MDVISLIVFVFCIVLFIWDKLPMATTAILGCALMVLLGVCDFKTAFGQFSSSTVILTVGVMVIGAAISETGLATEIGTWIVRIANGSERKLIAGTYLTAAVMSAFLTNSAVLAIFIPIIAGVSMANQNIKGKNLIMPIAYGCVIGGASTLVGSTQQMTAQGLLEEAGERMFHTFDFSLVGGILILWGLIYCLTIGYARGKKIWGDSPDEFTCSDEIKAVATDKRKMGIVLVIFLCTVILYITEWIPLALTSTLAALLCIITGCISQKKAIASVNWNIVGRLAACLGIAKALEVAGGTELISTGFRMLVGDSVNPWLLYCLLILMVQVTSQFISNSTAIMIVLPIILSIAPDMGLNTYAYALGITLSSGVALSCPLASSTLGMSMSVGYRFNDYFRYSILFEVVSYLIVAMTIPFIYGLTV